MYQAGWIARPSFHAFSHDQSLIDRRGEMIETQLMFDDIIQMTMHDETISKIVLPFRAQKKSHRCVWKEWKSVLGGSWRKVLG